MIRKLKYVKWYGNLSHRGKKYFDPMHLVDVSMLCHEVLYKMTRTRSIICFCKNLLLVCDGGTISFLFSFSFFFSMEGMVYGVPFLKEKKVYKRERC